MPEQNVHHGSLGVSWLIPEWPAPANVRALSTLRGGGVSRGPYDSLNLAAHVGDTPEAVAGNRARLMRAAGVPVEPRWLMQVHGTRVVDAAEAAPGVEADAAYALRPGAVCVVMTADCLPVLLCDRGGTRVAAVHAGWRGLADGVIETTLTALGIEPERLLAWLGPAIGPDSFEVGDEVRRRFMAVDPTVAELFRRGKSGHWWADLHGLARLRLEGAGVRAVYGGDWCTVRNRELFYSYRRDGETGRMASLIWLER